MSSKFWNNFPSVSKATFGVLSPPAQPGSAQRGAGAAHGETQNTASAVRTSSPAELLSQSGSENFRDVVERRHKAQLFQMGHVDDMGRPSQAHSQISAAIKDFFLSDTTRLEKHRNYEVCARRPSQYFDIRQVGTANESRDPSEAVQIFCCRYGEKLQSQPASKSSLTLAIPSLAGLKAPEAISLVNPLGMLPREYINEGEAGAILCFYPNSQRYVADLYWSPSAFVQSLSEVQTVGTMLIETDAMREAAENGVGVVDVHRASAILAKLYEAVAQVGQSVEEPFFSAGMWGVAVLPQRNDTYQCLVGVVALNIPHLSDGVPDNLDAAQSLFISKRHFAVASFRLYRDDFGFLKIQAEDCSLLPLKPLAWFDRLPAVA